MFAGKDVQARAAGSLACNVSGMLHFIDHKSCRFTVRKIYHDVHRPANPWASFFCVLSRLLCAICETWLRAWERGGKESVLTTANSWQAGMECHLKGVEDSSVDWKKSGLSGVQLIREVSLAGVFDQNKCENRHRSQAERIYPLRKVGMIRRLWRIGSNHGSRIRQRYLIIPCKCASANLCWCCMFNRSLSTHVQRGAEALAPLKSW